MRFDFHEPDLPFAHLNLRRNPFGHLPREEKARLAVVSADRYEGRLLGPGFVVQYLGGEGRGKTTHLLALRNRIGAGPYVHLPRDGPPPRIPDGSPLFLDEAQRMPSRALRSLSGRGASFAVASHTDLSEGFHRAGLDVETVRLRGLSPERLLEIARTRTAAARRSDGPVPGLTRTAAAALIGVFGDDVRAILDRLYDILQRLREPRPLTPGDVVDGRTPRGKEGSCRNVT